MRKTTIALVMAGLMGFAAADKSGYAGTPDKVENQITEMDSDPDDADQSFKLFTDCVSRDAVDLAAALRTLGETNVRRFYSWYDSQSDEVKAAIKAAAGSSSGRVLTAALTVAGLEITLAVAAGIALAVANEAFGVAVVCADRHLL